MIVVSDTSPLTALLTIGQADILSKLFHEVIIPEAVHRELLRCHAILPAWIRIRAVQNRTLANQYAKTVDAGEAEAIALAKELHADHLLIDERKGRQLAAREGLPVVGLLGVILLAKKRRFISSARSLLNELESNAGIYLSSDVKEAALKKVGE